MYRHIDAECFASCYAVTAALGLFVFCCTVEIIYEVTMNILSDQRGRSTGIIVAWAKHFTVWVSLMLSCLSLLVLHCVQSKCTQGPTSLIMASIVVVVANLLVASTQRASAIAK